MKNKPNKMNGNSLDISTENRARLKALFPSVFTETVNDTGELVESVDFEKLKAEMGTFTDLFESRRERYGMDWPGKKDALQLIQTPSYATLKPCREESVNFDTTENLFIEGDNLEVLKLLQKSYYGKVKMIDIDPPYNTGKEFIYPDNYSESLDTYLEYAGLIDGEGKKFSTNTANEGRFHTKWLNMMYPRLYLARNLLRDDGVIFIHIDDNEVSNLRKVCDEIFGEENFVATYLWKKKGTTTNVEGAKVSSLTEYIICYKKSENDGLNYRVVEKETRNYPFNDAEGRYRSTVIEKKNAGAYERKTMQFEIVGQKPREGKRWQIGEDLARKLEKKNRFYIDDGIVKLKIYDFEDKDTTSAYPNLLFENGSTDSAASQLNDLFGVQELFDNPKPTELLNSLITYCDSENKDSIILDFFAGSCTTAHAVLDQNKQDGGNRKFIMVQLPEPCDEDSEAFKAGYKTIADIGKERIRRVIKKLNDEEAGKLALNDNVKQDRGFKVLKLNKSNFKQWQNLAPDTKPEQIQKQLFEHIDHINHKATPEDLLYEILIKAGFTPTERVQTVTLAGIPVFSIADGGLLICLADAVTKELVNAVAEAEPMQFICLDKAFGGNDQLKANAVQTFNACNMGKEKHNQIIFRTV